MPAKKKSSTKHTPPPRKSAGAPYIRHQAAPAKPVDVAPSTSVLQRTAPYLDEVTALDSLNLETFNIIEVKRRIDLLAYMHVERALRENAINDPKFMADYALRVINTIEGSRIQSEIWVHDAKKPTPIDIEAYNAELRDVIADIERMKSVKSAREDAETALETVGGEPCSCDDPEMDFCLAHPKEDTIQ